MSSLHAINQRMRNLDLRLKNENDSNRRCSFDNLLNNDVNKTENNLSTSSKSNHTTVVSISSKIQNNLFENNLNDKKLIKDDLSLTNDKLINTEMEKTNKNKLNNNLKCNFTFSNDNQLKKSATIKNDLSKQSIKSNYLENNINITQIKNTCSNLFERLSASINNYYNYNLNRNPTVRDINSNLKQHRYSRNNLNSSVVNSKLAAKLPASVNAQCLSPRPRPKELNMNSKNLGKNLNSFKPLNINPISAPENKSLKDKFGEKNNLITIDGNVYDCKESDFTYIEELGSGSCGFVAKMEFRKSGTILAVKQMRGSSDPDENKRISMDLDVHLKCRDFENIVQCYGYSIRDTRVWIFMELMTTCLDKFLKKTKTPIPEPICGKIAVASVTSLNYLKETHSVMHRDVKPSNILINEQGIIKLCDFGISGRLVDSKAKTKQGCGAYMAPERIEPPDPTKPSYDVRADVWSLGITLVELALGKYPYTNCNNDFELLTKIISSEPPLLPNDGTFSPDFCSFIECCLQKDVQKRSKYKQLLNHPFIKKYERLEINVEEWFSKAYLDKN